ncbi:MAG: DUF1553 domain-containing protein [Planctomycetaceae bacterium]
MRSCLALCLWVVWHPSVASAQEKATAGVKVRFEEVAGLLKSRCVKCHGPGRSERSLNLSTPAGILRGSRNGVVVRPHDVMASPLWTRIADGSMPPDDPLDEDQQGLLARWIDQGAPGLSAESTGEHWAFRPLDSVSPPIHAASGAEETSIDQFLLVSLATSSLEFSSEADRPSLLRRASLVLTGLPPTIEEQEAFLGDLAPDAYGRLIDRLLASPQMGVRWGKLWLDAAGYADSNGYFNADSDRPWAWRYRDWVIGAINSDLPFDEFLRAQLCGDELISVETAAEVSADTQGLLIATHFLRNGQDGTGESDGNPEEVRADKYFALESCQQNVMSALFGLTVQCAKCHDHKFEPIRQEDYYRLQAVFAPAFRIDDWRKPNERFVMAPLIGETEVWELQRQRLRQELQEHMRTLADYVRSKRVPGRVLFHDDFDRTSLGERWSNRLPGDTEPAGTVPVRIDSRERPGAFLRDGQLVIAEGGTKGDSILSTAAPLNWVPSEVGATIEATFDLVSNRGEDGDAEAERIGYLIDLRDFQDRLGNSPGNVLIDGHPKNTTSVYLDYPGADSRIAGSIGGQGHVPGRNLGVRITRISEDQVRLQMLVDHLPDGQALDLQSTAFTTGGGFGFVYCCGRSFVVDNVLIEAFPPVESSESLRQFHAEVQHFQSRSQTLRERLKNVDANPPGKISWVTDVSPSPPEVRLLSRGNYSSPAHVVTPGPPLFLSQQEEDPHFLIQSNGKTTGSRRAFAEWVLKNPRSRSLLARTQVNRIWQACFGRGIVATSDNLGQSGASPSHPELLEYLAKSFLDQGWRMRPLLREIVMSRAFRQSSLPNDRGLAADPENHLLWRFPSVRLDADMIRDSLWQFSGRLDCTLGGMPVPTTRLEQGEVVVSESAPGVARRSLYVYQRRTQGLGMLQLFDAPQLVFNSTKRSRSTIPLQSLAILNGDFVIRRAEELARRLEEHSHDTAQRIEMLWRICLGRSPHDDEVALALGFLREQAARLGSSDHTLRDVWRDLCQSVLGCNEALYLP